MGDRHGVQAEVLLSLALVMVTCTGLLAAVLLEVNHARVESLHSLLGKGFLAESRDPALDVRPREVGQWWRVEGTGQVVGLSPPGESIDALTLRLALESDRLDQPMVQSGAPWQPLRFGAPRQHGTGVIAARIDAPVSGAVLLLLLVTDVLIFGLFGITLLRRRVVGPLHRLAESVRALGDQDLPARVPVEGVAEIEALGVAFNDMQQALAQRTGALEKAVLELRAANLDLGQAREGLDRAERLAMVGSLAAGVAHEVGNPMAALLAFLDLVGRDEGLGTEGHRLLGRASEQGERVRVILRQLLDFSRAPEIEHGPIRLDEIARQVVELISAQKEYAGVQVEVDVEEGIGTAWGDSGAASQILLNLALNAVSAMEDSPAKRLRIEVGADVLQGRAADEEDGDGQHHSRSDAIGCWVVDSGPGIESENAERLFDPFYTTKAPGEGTGLGLANARRLAAEMGGRVDVDPRKSVFGGARFRFSLPREEQAGSEQEGPAIRVEAPR